MRVVFVSLGQPLLGVEYLSACLKRAGHATALVHNPALFNDRFHLHFPRLARFFDQDELIVRRILEHEPDLLAFSALTPTFSWMADIARRVRAARPETRTVFGGVHPSACPEYVISLDAVDFVCVGEGEEALVRLADDIDGGGEGSGIPNIWSKAEGSVRPPPSVARFIQDLDAMPFPDKELYADAFPTWDIYHIVTGRGCPFRCTFCFNNNFAALPTGGDPKEYVRRRSVDNVLRELRAAKKRFGFRTVWFWDDIFTMNPDWLGEFLPRYKREVGVPWTAQTHPSFTSDRTARLMKEAGCVKVQVGVQTLGDVAYKRAVLKRGESPAKIAAMFDSFRKAELELVVDHMFGLPHETAREQETALRFYLKHAPARISTFFMSYMPGLEITRYALDNGIITEADIERAKRGELMPYHEVALSEADAPEQRRLIRGYACAFILLPVVPGFLRRFLRPRFLGAVPLMVPFAKAVGFAALVLRACLGRDFAGRHYLTHYRFYLFGPGRKLNKAPARAGRRGVYPIMES